MQPVHLGSSNFYMIENSKIRSKINYRGLKLVTYNMQKNQGCANVHAVPSMISLIHLYENIGLQYLLIQFSLISLDNFYNDLFFSNLHVFRRVFLVTFTGLTFSISV